MRAFSSREACPQKLVCPGFSTWTFDFTLLAARAFFVLLGWWSIIATTMVDVPVSRPLCAVRPGSFSVQDALPALGSCPFWEPALRT